MIRQNERSGYAGVQTTVGPIDRIEAFIFFEHTWSSRKAAGGKFTSVPVLWIRLLRIPDAELDERRSSLHENFL
jgi:hypothetical protein